MLNAMNRRRFLQTTTAGASVLLSGTWPAGRALAAEDLTIGVVYVGARDDFGWNQAHAVGVAALKQVPGVKVIEEENVPETDAVSKTMESMISLDGAKLILPTSFGYYSPFVHRRGQSQPRGAVSPRGPALEVLRPEERGFLFRVPGPGSLHRRRRRRPCLEDRQARFRGRETDRHRPAQHQLVPDRRPHDQSGRDRPGDLHGRLVPAGARSGGNQRARRRRLRSDHLPRGRSQGGDSDSRNPRGQILRAQCRPISACPERLRHRSGIQVGHDLHRIRRT